MPKSKNTPIQSQINRNTGTNVNFTQSMYGRASTNGRTAGGAMRTFSTNSGQGAGRSGQLASRRQRYYDVRVGLGLSGG